MKITKEKLNTILKSINAEDNFKMVLVDKRNHFSKSLRLLLSTGQNETSKIIWMDGKTGRLGSLSYQTDIVAHKIGNEWHISEEYLEKSKESVDSSILQEIPPVPSPKKERMEKAQALVSKVVNPSPVPAPVVEEIQDDFVSVTELQSHTHKGSDLFIALRARGQIVFPIAISKIIGTKNFDLQISTSKRNIRIIVGSGPMNMPESNKMSCVTFVKKICDAKGLKGDMKKHIIGRIDLVEFSPNVYIGEF